LQYECSVEGKVGSVKRKDDAVVRCWPVERFFRRYVCFALSLTGRGDEMGMRTCGEVVRWCWARP
jgi:hypothetical protein